MLDGIVYIYDIMFPKENRQRHIEKLYIWCIIIWRALRYYELRWTLMSAFSLESPLVFHLFILISKVSSFTYVFPFLSLRRLTVFSITANLNTTLKEGRSREIGLLGMCFGEKRGGKGRGSKLTMFRKRSGIRIMTKMNLKIERHKGHTRGNPSTHKHGILNYALLEFQDMLEIKKHYTFHFHTRLYLIHNYCFLTNISQIAIRTSARKVSCLHLNVPGKPYVVLTEGDDKKIWFTKTPKEPIEIGIALSQIL